MSLPSQSSIRLHDDKSEWRFDWNGFDGDDCFMEFAITVSNKGRNQRFEFGAAVVRGLRKLSRFFEDASQTTVDGGFRNPDVRSYEIHRSGQNYRLIVENEDPDKREEFHLERPSLLLDREFLAEYDGDEQ